MLTRIITGLVCIPLAIWLVSTGGLVFATAVLVLAGIAWSECRNMSLKNKIIVFPVTSGLPTICLVGAAGIGNKELLLPFLIVGIIAILCEAVVRYCHVKNDSEKVIQSAAFSALILLYVGLLFAHIPLLREASKDIINVFGYNLTKGECYLWLALLGTWASDTFAYFIGVAIGKHPLCSVSPKKSVEGAVAGFIGSVTVVYAIATMVLNATPIAAIVLGLIIAIVAPIGDLVESALKRSFDIKDSGNVFPGHGGVLDRFDSLMFVIPVAYYVIQYFQI